MKTKLIAIVVIVLAIGGIALAATHKSATKNETATSGNTGTMQHMPMNSQGNQAANSGQAVATNTVSIQNFAFSPAVITVKAGTTVTWTNQDEVHHSITTDTASADAPSSSLLGKGESYSFTFKKAGTYTYHCMPHPYMHGTVIVTE